MTPVDWTVRVYYEDTDAGGVVYYANYLKFAERARTEALRSVGLEQTELMEKSGIAFVVRHCEAEFFRPARLDDLIRNPRTAAQSSRTPAPGYHLLRVAYVRCGGDGALRPVAGYLENRARRL